MLVVLHIILICIMTACRVKQNKIIIFLFEKSKIECYKVAFNCLQSEQNGL